MFSRFDCNFELKQKLVQESPVSPLPQITVGGSEDITNDQQCAVGL